MSDIILITGSNRGLGKNVAELLGNQGHQVVLTARISEKGMAIARALKELGHHVYFHPIDLQAPDDFHLAKEFLMNKFGRLDVLINNAAIHYDLSNDVLKPDFQIVEEGLTTNLTNTWRLTCELIPLLRNSDHGRIVNVSSQSGALTGMGGGAPGYSISKAGLNVLTIKLATALKTENILVNSVCPGWVKTDMGGLEAPRSLQQGAESIIWAATLPKDGPSGGFFRDGHPIDW